MTRFPADPDGWLSGDMLAGRMNTIHNLTFYLRLMQRLREAERDIVFDEYATAQELLARSHSSFAGSEGVLRNQTEAVDTPEESSSPSEAHTT